MLCTDLPHKKTEGTRMLCASLGSSKPQDSSRPLFCTLNPIMDVVLLGASVSHGIYPDPRSHDN